MGVIVQAQARGMHVCMLRVCACMHGHTLIYRTIHSFPRTCGRYLSAEMGALSVCAHAYEFACVVRGCIANALVVGSYCHYRASCNGNGWRELFLHHGMGKLFS